MRLESLRIRGIGPFADVNLNLADCPGKLVAVTGENGAGKSTLLGLFPAALYRTVPTRGALSSLATGRDSMVEARVVNGRAFTITQHVDGVSGKSEAMVVSDGAPVLADSKVRGFDAWAASYLPAQEVFFSSVFSAQKSQGLMTMKAGERKGILLRALGVERLEAQAEHWREQARRAKTELATTSTRIADERERGGDFENAQAELDAARARVVTATAETQTAEHALATLRLEVAQVDAIQAEAQRIEARRAELSAELSAAKTAIADMRARLDNNRDVIAQAEQIRQAVADADRIGAELETVRAQATEAALEVERAAGRVSGAEAIQRRAAQLEATRTQLEAWLDEWTPKLVEASAGAADIETNVGYAQLDVAALNDEVDHHRRATLNNAEGRILGLRAGLQSIADAASLGLPNDGLSHRAAVTLSEDDAEVLKASEAPVQLRDAQARLREAEDRLVDLTRSLADVRATLSRQSQADEKRAALADTQRELASIEAVDITAAHEALNAAKAVRREREQMADTLAGELQALERLTSRAAHLDRAEARIGELTPELAKADERAAKLSAELAVTTVPAVAPAPPIEPAEGALQAARRAEQTARERVALAEQALTQANASAARIEALTTEQRSIEQHLADCQRLAADLGRDGLQAAEIDSAGPELTELANDLLRSCVGPRWTVRIETTKLSADGKRQLEGCEIEVLDSEPESAISADWRPVETLSGGEAVIVGEAIALALSMLSMRRLGVDRPTLVRDESGAALSPENTRAWMAMLRRSAELVDADKVLIVSHNPEVWELCDSRLDIRGGKVEVS